MGWSMDQVHGVVHGPGPWGGPWTRSMGWSMDQVHGVVHGPGPWGGPWTPVHVLYMLTLWFEFILNCFNFC